MGGSIILYIILDTVNIVQHSSFNSTLDRTHETKSAIQTTDTKPKRPRPSSHAFVASNKSKKLSLFATRSWDDGGEIVYREDWNRKAREHLQTAFKISSASDSDSAQVHPLHLIIYIPIRVLLFPFYSPCTTSAVRRSATNYEQRVKDGKAYTRQQSIFLSMLAMISRNMLQPLQVPFAPTSLRRPADSLLTPVEVGSRPGRRFNSSVESAGF